MKLADLYWLAGLLEGEGCFGMSGSKSGSARIALNMTDYDVVERAALLLDTPVKYSKLYPNRKQVYRIEIFSNKAASWMMTLYSLMGERRQETILNSLTLWKEQRFKNKSGLGRKNPRTKKEGKVCECC
jgi:hypothetical protein